MKILSSPVEARGLFGAGGAPKADVSVIVPDNDVLGSALVHKVRNLRLLPGEEHHLTSNFCQTPQGQRFSILAYRRGNIFDVAGFITLSWSFEFVEEDSDDQDQEFILSISVESFIVDADLRGQGYGTALIEAALFWLDSILFDIDKLATPVGCDMKLTVLVTGDAVAAFPADAVEKFFRAADKNISRLPQKRSFLAFSRISLEADLTSGGNILPL